MTAEHPRPQRVLIVDDDARLVFVMQEVLGDAGYETKVAQEAKDFKVVVTLTNPPENLRPGLSTTAKVTTASKQNALAIPVVVATTEDDSQALDLGAAVKLTKPFTLEQLLDGVAVALAPA